VSKYFQSKVSGIIIDDTQVGTGHAWSPNRIIQEIGDRTSEFKSKLADLTDVNMPSTITNGYVLMYNSVSKVWEPKPISTTFNGLTDVSITNIVDGQFPRYDNVAKKWKNVRFTSDMITDLDLTSKTNGNVIKYDTSSGKLKLAPNKLVDLQDVNPTGLADRVILQYSLAENKFKTVPVFKLDELKNVNASGLDDGYVLYYDKINTEFKFKKMDAKTNLADLLDVDATGVTDGSVIKFSSEDNKYITEQISLEDLLDVDLSNLADGFILKYSSTKGKFVAMEAPQGSGGSGDVTVIDRLTQNNYNTVYNSTEQITKLGVIATPEVPKEVDIEIPYIQDFNLGKAEVLKYVPGPESINTLVKFDNGDSTDFNYNGEFVKFDGKMSLIKEKTFNHSKVETLDSGKVFTIPITKGTANITKITANLT
jgi:hypothetical protein